MATTLRTNEKPKSANETVSGKAIPVVPVPYYTQSYKHHRQVHHAKDCSFWDTRIYETYHTFIYIYIYLLANEKEQREKLNWVYLIKFFVEMVFCETIKNCAAEWSVGFRNSSVIWLHLLLSHIETCTRFGIELKPFQVPQVSNEWRRSLICTVIVCEWSFFIRQWFTK